MSAPNQGRQSPEPENQTGAQQQDIPGTGRTSVGNQPSAEDNERSQRSQEDFKNNLPSNPESEFGKIQGDKYAKDKQN
jgi:hypothetical protein